MTSPGREGTPSPATTTLSQAFSPVVPTAQTTPVLRVPVAAEDRPVVSCEHSLTSIRTADVPKLHIAILKGGGKGKVVTDAELDIPYTLRLACGQGIIGGRGEGAGPLWLGEPLEWLWDSVTHLPECRVDSPQGLPRVGGA